MGCAECRECEKEDEHPPIKRNRAGSHRSIPSGEPRAHGTLGQSPDQLGHSNENTFKHSNAISQSSLHGHEGTSGRSQSSVQPWATSQKSQPPSRPALDPPPSSQDPVSELGWLRKDLARCERAHVELLGHISEAEAQTRDAYERRNQADQQTSVFKAGCAQLQAELTSVRQELERLRSQLANSSGSRARAPGIVEVNAERDSLKSMLNSHTERITALEAEVAVARADFQKRSGLLNRQVQELERTHEFLRLENQRLLQKLEMFEDSPRRPMSIRSQTEPESSPRPQPHEEPEISGSYRSNNFPTLNSPPANPRDPSPRARFTRVSDGNLTRSPTLSPRQVLQAEEARKNPTFRRPPHHL